ncbi:NADH-cytochrome b5 reductase-like [Anoplophora glabripennis]|uniref:NADH-cytochrome b5 reductase-like n=1 Tax=Anoplophora glabripennis TaxID=217634 RepID=UPI00087524D2|nr:NADH-cytochrome b5 reductase-like [Anoplophora glabripennis]
MEPPIEPDESDCCNSGCNPCILDVYEEQLRKYKQRTSSLITKNNCISLTSYAIFKLINIEKHWKQTFLFTFEYCGPQKGEPKVDASLLYKPGQHFLMKGKTYDEEFTRAYTPIPIENQSDLQFTTLIKLYEYGVMSRYLKKISIGRETLWRGPYGDFTINYDIQHMLLIAQGTGLAPLYSIAYDIVNNDECCTFLKLFFCCKDSNSIYLREQLYKLSTYWNFSYEVFLSESQGISPKYNEIIHPKKLRCDEIETYLKDKHKSVNILICGSENFMEDIKKHVLRSSVAEEDVFTF